MKQKQMIKDMVSVGVAPRAGAWIETKRWLTVLKEYCYQRIEEIFYQPERIGDFHW
ncbi:hypothetical protein ICT70_03950 [Pelobacter sp. M08fum]|uniref:Uncharacterized protein n=1 Tax=Pelovirga terrestris TaxID=2771352 RepID=A0A8J6QWF1_9BACT|nr:hypothetical protein [Pelovirga terrestris]